MQTSPPGWLPDPTGRYHLRWFNGERFTADVSFNGQQFIDPLGATIVRPGLQAQPTRAMAIAGFVVALASLAFAWLPVMFVMGGLGAIVALVLSIIGWRTSRRFAGHGRRYAISGVCISVLALGLTPVGVILTRQVGDSFDDFADKGAYTATIDTCESDSGLTVVNGHLSNLDDAEHSYTVQIQFVVDNNVITSRYVDVTSIAPSEVGTFHVAEFIEGDQVDCVIADVF